MATVTVTFSWLSNPTTASPQGWTASTVGTSSTMTTPDATAGNPAGSLKVSVAGKNKTDTDKWTFVGNYSSLGVPVGSKVTEIKTASMQSNLTVNTTGGTTTLGTATLVDNTQAVTVTLAASRAITSATATNLGWVSQTGTDATGLSKDASNSITLTINATMATGASTSAVVTAAFDNLTFIITYTPPPVRLGGYGPNINRGLIGRWLFNEGVGRTAHDTSGNENTGTFAVGNEPSWTNDLKFGKVLKVTNVTSQWVNLTNTDSQADFSATDSFSVVFWAKYTSTYTQFNSILGKSTGSGLFTGWAVVMDQSGGSFGYFSMTDIYGNTVTCPSTRATTQGVWHLIACVANRTSNLSMISIDGLPFQTASISSLGSLTDNTGAGVQVGFNTCELYDLRIYRRPLALSEISTIFRNKQPVKPLRIPFEGFLAAPTTALTTDFYMPSNNKLAMILDYDDPIIGHLTLNKDITSPVMSRFTLNADVNDPLNARNAVPSADIDAPFADRVTLNSDMNDPAISRLTLNTDTNDPINARNAVPSADIVAPLSDRQALNSDMNDPSAFRSTLSSDANDPVIFRATITPDIATPLADRLALSADVGNDPLMMRSSVPSADMDAPILAKSSLASDIDAPEANRAGLNSDALLPILTALLLGGLVSDEVMPLAVALKLAADDINPTSTNLNIANDSTATLLSKIAATADALQPIIDRLALSSDEDMSLASALKLIADDSKPILTKLALTNDSTAPLLSKLTTITDALQPLLDRLTLSADTADNLMTRIVQAAADIIAPLFAEMGLSADQNSPLAASSSLANPNPSPLGSSIKLAADDTKPISTHVGFTSGDVALPIVTALLLLGLTTDRLFPLGSSLNLVADDINIITANRGVINEYVEPFASKQAFVIDSPIPRLLPMSTRLVNTTDRIFPDATLLAVTSDRKAPLAAVLQLTFGVSADRLWPFATRAALTCDQNNPLLSQLSLVSSRMEPLLTRLGLAVAADRVLPLFVHSGVVSTRRLPDAFRSVLQKDEKLRFSTFLKLSSQDTFLPLSDVLKLNGTNFFYFATLGGIVALTSREQFPLITSLKLDTSFLPALMMTTRSVWNAGYPYGDFSYSGGPFGFNGVPIFPFSFQNNVLVADQFVPLTTSLKLARSWIIPSGTSGKLSAKTLLNTSSALNLIKDEIEPLMTSLGVKITSDQIYPLLTRLIATTTADQTLPLADRLSATSDTLVPISSRLNLAASGRRIPVHGRMSVQTDRLSPLSDRQMMQTDRAVWLATQLIVSARASSRLGTELGVVSDKTAQILSRMFRQNDQLIPLGSSVLINNLVSDARVPLMTSIKLVADALDTMSAHLNVVTDRVTPTNAKLLASSGGLVEPVASIQSIAKSEKQRVSTSLNLAGDIVTRMLIRNALLGVKNLPVADRGGVASDPLAQLSTRASLITDSKLPVSSMVSLSVDAYLRIQSKVSLTTDTSLSLADALRLVHDETTPLVPGMSVTTQSGEAFFPIASRFALLADAASPLSSQLGLNGDEILRLMDRLDLVGDVALPVQAVLGLVRDLGSGHTMLPMLLAEALVPGGTIIAEPKRTRILAMPYDPTLDAEPKTTRVLRGGKRLV